MKFLLQRQSRWKTADGAAYADDVAHPRGYTSLLVCIATCISCSPGIAQLLFGAGADTTFRGPSHHTKDGVVLNHTPPSFTVSYLSDKDVDGIPRSEEESCTLEAIRRLLMMRMETVHVLSWLHVNVWLDGCLRFDHGATVQVSSKARTVAKPDKPPRRMSPLMR